MSTSTISPRSHLPWLVFARRVWLVFAILAGLLFLVGIPLRYRELATVTPDAAVTVGQLWPQDLPELNQTGWSLALYATYFTAAEVVTSLVYILVAALIFWRRGDEWIALYVATMLLLIPAALPVVSAVQRAQLVAPFVLQILQISFVTFLAVFLFVFPDGRVVPRWMRFVIVIWLLYALGTLAVPALLPPTSFGAGVTPDKYLPFGLMFVWFSLGLGAQVYRYARVSTTVQRQQTKWVVFGLAVFIGLSSVGVLLLFPAANSSPDQIDLFARIVAPTLLLAGILTIPLSIGFSILRYRLYDIDILIRRTVTYAILAALLVIIYFGSVILLQQAFAAVSGQRSEVITVISTLVIAALFVPLRNRIHTAIDRRFYRKKYDAQKVLNEFATTVRDETDLEKLTGSLVQVVNDTMQPKSVQLILRGSDVPRKREREG